VYIYFHKTIYTPVARWRPESKTKKKERRILCRQKRKSLKT
jgi:hypothetical protein